MNAKLETISENQAVQIIKQTRNVDGKDTANYYIVVPQKGHAATI